jgi:nucleoside-diphosphate-sugar epimerase
MHSHSSESSVDDHSVTSIFNNVDWVIHLASAIPQNGPAKSNPALRYYRNNAQIHSNVVALAAHHNVSIFIFVSSMLGYDMDIDRRFNSDDPSALEVSQVYIPLTNDSFSSYQMSKYLGEYELSLLPAESSMKYAILRLHTVYGPKYTTVKDTVTAEFLKRIKLTYYNLLHPPIMELIRLLLTKNQTGNMDFEVIGEPKQYLDMIYVGDAVDAIMQTVQVLNTTNKSIIEPLQIGSGIATKLSSIVDVLVQLIENCLGRTLRPFYFETHIHYRATGKVALTAKARNRLQGWQTKVNLVEGLSNLLASFAREEYPDSSIGSFLRNSLQCLAEAGRNTSMMPVVTRTTTAPVIAKPQDIRYPAPAGSIMDSLQKVCFHYSYEFGVKLLCL